jgi:hypothetical protein
MVIFLELPPALAQANRTAATNADIPSVAETKDAIQKEYEALLDADDTAQAEVDEWIQEMTGLPRRAPVCRRPN